MLPKTITLSHSVVATPDRPAHDAKFCPKTALQLFSCSQLNLLLLWFGYNIVEWFKWLSFSLNFFNMWSKLFPIQAHDQKSRSWFSNDCNQVELIWITSLSWTVVQKWMQWSQFSNFRWYLNVHCLNVLLDLDLVSADTQNQISLTSK